MPRKRFKTEQIMGLLRQVEVLVANGQLTPQACREAGISEQTYYRWRRITALLNQAGLAVGKDRVQRIWRRAGLKVPQRQKPRGRLWLNDGSCVRLRPERPNHVWSYDFVAAATHDGR